MKYLNFVKDCFFIIFQINQLRVHKIQYSTSINIHRQNILQQMAIIKKNVKK